MRRFAPLLTFLLFAGTSTLALADRQPPPADDKAEEKADDKAEEKTDDKSGDKADDKAAEKTEEKKSGCSISPESDAMFGFAALLLLGSGVALRRTRK
ncbi:MAG: hypothetical protein KC457_16965 [Myxococcales bacterium]|nr:hypothetical protein [Myxococcales bacterium]